MTVELWLAALVGAVVSIPGSLLLAYVQLRWSARQRLNDARFDLVRSLAQHKGGPQLAVALNQIPLLFGHDEEVMRAYRRALGPSGVRTPMDCVIDLLVLLAARVGLPDSVSKEDLAAGFDTQG